MVLYLMLSLPHSRSQGNMVPSGPEGDLLGGPGGVGAEGLTQLGGGGGPKPPEDFSGVEQSGVPMDPMESVMEPLQFDYNSQMQMDSTPAVGLFDYTNQQQVGEHQAPFTPLLEVWVGAPHLQCGHVCSCFRGTTRWRCSS